jgi:hypothetical protein
MRVQVVLASDLELPDLPEDLAMLPQNDSRRMDAVWQRLEAALPPPLLAQLVSWVEQP